MHIKQPHFPHKWIMTNKTNGRGFFKPGHGGDGHKHKDGESVQHESDRLHSQDILLLAISSLFAVANALSGTFVNVYIWKVKNDFALIGWFALSHQITMAITFWLAGKWVKEHNKMHSLRLGVAVSALFYMLVLMLEKQAADYVLLLGVVQGLSSGFFWLAFNVVYFEVTTPGNRDKFNGWAGLLGSGAGMFAPWISGFLITRMDNTSGYKLIFTISLVIFLIGVVVSFFLKKRKVKGKYIWLHAFHRLKSKGNPWRILVPALIAQGTREGVFGFIIGLMVFIATKNEMKLGNFSLISSAVALVSFMLVGKWLKPRLRKHAMLIGAVMMVVVIFPFFWTVNYTTLLIFGIGTALFIPLFTIPMTSTVFDIIGQDEESAKQRVEYVVLRELALNVGRIFGTVAFIITISWSKAPLVINIFLLIIGSSPVWAWLYMRKLKSLQHAK
jgi:YQGE family putative transporter